MSEETAYMITSILMTAAERGVGGVKVMVQTSLLNLVQQT